MRFRPQSTLQTLATLVLLVVLWTQVAAEKPWETTVVTQPSFPYPDTGLKWVPDQVVVKTKSAGVGAESITAGARGRHRVVRLKAGSDVVAAAKAYQHQPDVEWASPNYLAYIDQAAAGLPAPTDPLFVNQWGLMRIAAPSAWATSVGSAQVTVCTVDTGIDYTHPDLVANIHPDRGWSAVDPSGDPMDSLKHGTFVAGIMGAVGSNALEITGLNWKVKLLACKFTTGKVGASNNVADCIDYCVGKGARIIQASLTLAGQALAVRDAINRAGAANVLFVSSAGNYASDLAVNPGWPAAFNLPNQVVVASLSSKDAISFFSNYGNTSVHLGAPGEWIMSTITGGGTEYMQGTSFSSPFISGAAALLLAASNGRLGAVEIKRLILESVDQVPALQGKLITGGVLNVGRAMQMYLASVPSPAPPPPSGKVVLPPKGFCKVNTKKCRLKCNKSTNVCRYVRKRAA